MSQADEQQNVGHRIGSARTMRPLQFGAPIELLCAARAGLLVGLPTWGPQSTRLFAARRAFTTMATIAIRRRRRSRSRPTSELSGPLAEQTDATSSELQRIRSDVHICSLAPISCMFRIMQYLDSWSSSSSCKWSN